MPNTITPISPTDLALWRTSPYSMLGLLYIDNAPVVFRAQVDLAGGATYPIQDVPFKNVTVGSHSVLRQNQTVIFESTPGADDRGRQRIRRIDGSTSQIRIGRSSQGSEDGTVNALDNTYITVLDDRRVAPRIPYINPDTLETFKDGDFDFATYGVNQGALVCVGGGPIWIKYLKPSESVATLSINSAVDSRGVDGNIVSYANDIVDGTFTSGGSTTAAWTATFPPGRRYISVTITDTNGIVTTRELLVVVLKDGTAYVPIKFFKINGLNPKIVGGQVAQFSIYQSLTGYQASGGMLVCFFEREFYGKTEKTLNNQNDFSHIKFVGWHQTDQNTVQGTRQGHTRETVLTCLDINARLDTIPGFSQEIGRKASPSNWQEAKTANLDKFEVLNKRWLDTAIEFTDYIGANQGDTYAFSTLSCGEKTRYQQDEGLVDSAIAYHATCTMQGRLLLTPDPQIRGTDPDVIISLVEGDYTAIRYNGTRPPNYYWEQGGCVLTSTADVDSYVPSVKFAIAPGFSPGWGKQKNSLNQQLGTSLTEIEDRTKRRYVRNNARFGYIEVDLSHPGDFGYDPAYQQWIELTISDRSAAWLGVTWTTQKCLLVQTKISYPIVKRRHTKKVTLVLELRVDASNAGVEEPPIATDPNPPDPQPTVTTPTNTGVINCSGIQAAIGTSGNQILRADRSQIGLIINAKTSPKKILLSTTGLPVGFISQVLPDPFGSFWINRTGTAPAYCLADGGIYHITDIFDCSLSWAGYQSIAIDSTQFPAVMRVSHAVSGDVYVWAFVTGTGNKRDAYRVTNSGISWHVGLGLGKQFAPLSWAMDIDQHGADEMWVAFTGDAFDPNIWIYQILNGVATLKFEGFNWAFRGNTYPRFIQKPQLTPSGAPNTSTSTPTILLGMAADADRPCLVRSDDGFATYTDLSPTPRLTPGGYISSMIAGDNPNILIESVVPTADVTNCITCSTQEGLWVSRNGGLSPYKISGTTKHNAGFTCGYLANNHNQLYAAGDTDAVYVNGLTGIAQSTLGDWIVSGWIHTEIPL